MDAEEDAGVLGEGALEADLVPHQPRQRPLAARRELLLHGRRHVRGEGQ